MMEVVLMALGWGCDRPAADWPVLAVVPDGRQLRPAAALEAWLAVAAVTEGPVFRRLPRRRHAGAAGGDERPGGDAGG